ncbi:CMRF35-like molecule 1 [Eublepharis macularius]|uniref:CMRF35-like molecule 1 n=1 Tax=Eublepharis macularius TaxID=481883 RepID=A0AA97KW46_EUBMA|nr:CMRF35-like molecule 1 [Eublepharis macularius]
MKSEKGPLNRIVLKKLHWEDAFMALLIKSSSGDLVKDDRVSIRDNKKESYFEITMDKLKQEDSDTYQCGIERGALNDRHYIRVEVSPDPKKTSTTEELFTSTATIAVAKSNPTPPPSQGSKEQKLYILIYCIIPLFLLLLAAAVVLLIISKKKKKGWNSKKEKKPQSMVLALNKVDAGSEHRIPGHHLGTDGTEFYSNVEVNPGNNYEELPSQEKSSDRSDEVSYATLNISDPQQLSVYANVGPVLSKIQEIFYTEVAIKPKE